MKLTSNTHESINRGISVFSQPIHPPSIVTTIRPVKVKMRETEKIKNLIVDNDSCNEKWTNGSILVFAHLPPWWANEFDLSILVLYCKDSDIMFPVNKSFLRSSVLQKKKLKTNTKSIINQNQLTKLMHITLVQYPSN